MPKAKFNLKSPDLQIRKEMLEKHVKTGRKYEQQS